jgi:hypothetical protein
MRGFVTVVPHPQPSSPTLLPELPEAEGTPTRPSASARRIAGEGKRKRLLVLSFHADVQLRREKGAPRPTLLPEDELSPIRPSPSGRGIEGEGKRKLLLVLSFNADVQLRRETGAPR